MRHHEKFNPLLHGVVLAFIVPTLERTCGYACPKCIFRLQNDLIDPRDFGDTQLSPDSIDDMIREYYEESLRKDWYAPIGQFAIQGLNPFYDELSQECSKCILAWSHVAPVSFVSSGDGVRTCIDAIADARATCGISIDAGPDKNPILRPAVRPDGTPDPSRNSYEVAIDALRALCDREKLHDRIYITCTVMPKQAQNAVDVMQTLPIDLLSHVQFVFSPYIAVNTGKIGISKDEFLHTAQRLIAVAQENNQTVLFDDEDNDYQLRPDHDLPREMILDHGMPYRIKRIYPNGKIHDYDPSPAVAYGLAPRNTQTRRSIRKGGITTRLTI